jgi:hypothetical protein
VKVPQRDECRRNFCFGGELRRAPAPRLIKSVKKACCAASRATSGGVEKDAGIPRKTRRFLRFLMARAPLGTALA